MGPEFYEQLVETSSRHGGFAHGGTYHGHPVAAAVALETIRIFERRRILDHVQSILPAWSQVIARLGEHPLVARTRNIGLMAGLDLGQPGAPWHHEVAKSLGTGSLPTAVYAAGLAEGIIVRPLARSIVMAPPLIITLDEIAELERRLTRALDTVLAAQGKTPGQTRVPQSAD